MSKNIYVGNLSFEATAADLEAAFGQHGTVQKAQVVNDRETGRSRGFGFVEMSDGGDAAIQALNGTQVGGRAWTVNEAKPRADRPTSGGPRRGAGGYKAAPRGGTRREAPAVPAGASFFLSAARRWCHRPTRYSA